MSVSDFFSDFNFLTLIFLSIFSFIAGFIDAVVGGGGLISVPALLIQLPNLALPTLFGTNKIASLSGTSIAAYQYSKKIKFDYKLLFWVSISSFVSSFCGAKVVSYIHVNQLKPLILIILILIALYTFLKKDLGAFQSKQLSQNKKIVLGSLLGILVGFYDGFFGPGTGSFFVLGFVVWLGFEFLEASAYSKIINCVTNISALIVFIREGHFILPLAIIMAVFNISGNWLGSHIALKKGNQFIRIIFLLIVSIMILRYGYDIFWAHS